LTKRRASVVEDEVRLLHLASSSDHVPIYNSLFHRLIVAVHAAAVVNDEQDFATIFTALAKGGRRNLEDESDVIRICLVGSDPTFSLIHLHHLV
jgi:hypothetical protein